MALPWVWPTVEGNGDAAGATGTSEDPLTDERHNELVRVHEMRGALRPEGNVPGPQEQMLWCASQGCLLEDSLNAEREVEEREEDGLQPVPEQVDNREELGSRGRPISGSSGGDGQGDRQVGGPAGDAGISGDEGDDNELRNTGTSGSDTERDIWAHLARIKQCESGGDYRAIGENDRFFGAYQFSVSTWMAVGGSGNPRDASPAEQDYRAYILYTQYGPQHWPVCQYAGS